MLMISRRTGETDQDFANRAFRWNRLCGKAFEDRQARHALCNCNQGRLACGCGDTYSASPVTAGKLNQRLQFVDGVLDLAPTGATPLTLEDMRAMGTPLAFGAAYPMTRVRAIWYGAGLVFAVSLIAVAVFGMGQ
jgi:hypothetical protein